MLRRLVVPAASVTALVALLMLTTALVASAHERREVGDFDFVVGWRVEPAFLNQPNGLDLRIQRGHGEGGTPVEGAHETLQAEVIFGSETMPLELRGRFGMPGSYTSDVFPTSEGAYSFRIFGTVEGVDVDETFTAGPDTFGEIETVDAISFPAGGADDAADGASASAAQDTADTAQTLATIGIIVGVLGLIAGAIGAWMAMQARSARTRS